MHLASRYLLCLLLGGGFVITASADTLPMLHARQAAMRPGFDTDIDRVVAEAIDAGKMPGCVVVVGRSSGIVHQQAYGNRRVEPSVEPMTLDTVFDLASLTKPIATSTSVMQLVEQGHVRLRDRVADYFPEYDSHGKGDTTIEQLLVHSAGLIPDNPIDDYRDGWPTAYEKICQLKALSTPGKHFKYSDVGFLLLGDLVYRVTGQPLDEYVQANIFEPLGMKETTFNPPASLCERAATTEKVNDEWLRGTVHDPRARLLGGVAGHAGLFSTAHDLSIFATALLRQGTWRGHRVLMPRTIQEWTRARDIDGQLRALGWDKQSAYSRNRGEMMSDSAFGHGGFTGTAMWIDPALDLYVIFLSNRVHPDGSGSVNDLAGKIGTIASAACLEPTGIQRAPSRQGRSEREVIDRPTQLGVDRLAEEGFELLKGKRVGLIANHTSRTADGTPTVELFAESDDVNLVALFSPEHGITGTFDQPHIGDTVEAATQLPVYSLYGETRRPTAEQLATIDVLVFDIQDIGCRFYTYLSTMGLAMEAAAEHGVEFVVLDRPNPINGRTIEGPLLDSGKESFVGYHEVPIRHGMTAGELARMFRQERDLPVQITVVELKNWRRGDYLFDTGLPWINTSPNMRSLTQALLYPGVGLFETTNVSVGRGTDTPFEVLGAPWIDGRKLAAGITSHEVPGLRVVPIRFTPTSSKHEGTACEGVNFVVTDWRRFRPLKLAWAIGASLREQYPHDWEHQSFPRLLIDSETYQLLVAGASPAEIEASYSDELRRFRERRKPFLLY